MAIKMPRIAIGVRRENAAADLQTENALAIGRLRRWSGVRACWAGLGTEVISTSSGYGLIAI
jgi:hypothetical protein